MATPPEDSVEIISSSVDSQIAKHLTLDSQDFCILPSKTPDALDGKKVYETVASLDEIQFRRFLDEVTSQGKNSSDQSTIALAAQLLLRKEEDALKEESGSGEDTQELLSACHKRKRLLKGKNHCDNSAASRTSTGGSLGSLQDLTETKVPESSSAAGTKSGGSCGNLSRGSFKTQAPLKQRGKRLKVGRASTSIREGGSLQNLSKAEVVSNAPKKLHKSGSLSQVFTDVGGARIKNRRQKTSSESSGSRIGGRKSEEKDVASDAECSDIPYRLLSVTSPLPAATEMHDKGGASKPWHRDRMSDVASGESTEEDGESFHSVARSKLSNATITSYGAETELMSVVTHTAHKDNGLHLITPDSEVDRKIKFSLGSSRETSLESGRNHIPIMSSFVEVGEFVTEKRNKSVKSDMSEKSTLESRPLKASESNLNVTINSMKTSYDDIAITHRSNGYSYSGSKDSNYHRMKAKCDKKKILKKKNEIPIEETPGYVGDAPFSEILTFINDKNSNQKGKKKHKNKKDEGKDDKENSRKKKNGERVSNNISALTETGALVGCKDPDRKKGATLRETSSVEDLVSKSKQSEADFFVKKQVAAEDGDESPSLSKLDGTSEFSHDFYRVGDALLNDEVMQESGEFEVVNRKKSRKNRIVSTTSAEKIESFGSKENSFESQKRYSPPTKGGRTAAARPAMNFCEGLNFDGDVIFNKWPSNKGSNVDRIGHTTSAPHSEGSDSDGDDSVHSMPVKSMTPKPEMRNHPQSSDSTPQASYANIAKLSSKKRLERAQRASMDDSSLQEMHQSQVNMSHFPPLAENSRPDTAAEDPSGAVFSRSDLATSTTVRRNSVSNELLSKQVANVDSSAKPSQVCLKPSTQSPNVKNMCPNLSNSQSDPVQQNGQCQLESSKHNSTSKPTNRKEGKANPSKTTNKDPKAKTKPAVVFKNMNSMPADGESVEVSFGSVQLEDMFPASTSSSMGNASSADNKPVASTSHSKKGSTNGKSVADLFRQLFVPPKDDVFQHQEAIHNLFIKSWEKTLKMMEENPEDIQVWKCPSRCDSPVQTS